MITLVYGQRGSGKSWRARALLTEDLSSEGGRALVVDTLREHSDLFILSLDSVGVWSEHPDTRGSTVRITPHSEEELSRAFRQLEKRRVEPVSVMIDEVSYWSKPNYTVEGLSRLVRYGRHYRIDLIGVARRPAETSRELSSQADRIILQGRTVEPADRLYLSRILPESAFSDLDSLSGYRALSYSTSGELAVLEPVSR